MINKTPYNHLIERLMPFLAEYGIDTSRWTVEMSDTLRTTGGRCRVNSMLRTVTLQLNQELFERIGDTERWNVLAHEAAHGVCFEIGRWSDGHGPIWKRIHDKMGGDALRTHRMEVKHNLVKRYVLTDRTHPGAIYTVSSQKAKKYINWNPVRFTVIGVTLCDRNTMTWRWEKLYDHAMREAAVFTKLRRIE